MTKNILYVASAIDLATGSRLATGKIGIATNDADPRIRQLNSTKMPIAVELVGAWSFEGTSLSAEAVEKAAHYLLAPSNVSGEWFSDPDDDLADRVGKFAERLGARAVGDDTVELRELNAKKRAALEEMKSVFGPIERGLNEAGIDWEYMTWKVGMDSLYGRLNIQVRKTGKLYVRLHLKGSDLEKSLQMSGLEWKRGVQGRWHTDMAVSQLISFVSGGRVARSSDP